MTFIQQRTANRRLLAFAMGWTHFEVLGGSKLCWKDPVSQRWFRVPPDPFNDWSDWGALLEWATNQPWFVKMVIRPNKWTLCDKYRAPDVSIVLQSPVIEALPNMVCDILRKRPQFNQEAV